jgi:hypothetical protein
MIENIKMQNKTNDYSTKKIFFLISTIVIGSFLIRIYYFDYNIPLTLDSLDYFFYAMDIKITNQIPVNYSLANNGWALFLSIFFSTFQFDDINQYMQLQRLMAISISSLTVIPVYFLCKKFFNSRYSLIGAIIVGIEPHLIQNSLVGISDSLYIFLVALSLNLFLDSRQKMLFLSFGFASLATIVRSEGIFLFFVMSLMYLIINRKNKKNIFKYVLALTIFIIVLTPMIIHQNSIYGDDRMFGRAAQSIVTHTIDPEKTGNISGISFIIQGLENFPKYLGWNMIPIWIAFVPLGTILILKNMNAKTNILISSIIIMSLPTFYAYSIALQDGRYFFFLYPIFSVISLFTIKKILEYFTGRRKYFIFSLILIGIIISSIIYLNEKIDNNHENESFQLAKILSDSKKNVNVYLPENKYLEITDINFKFIDFKLYYLDDRINGKSIRNSINHNVTSIKINNINSIDELIKSSVDNNITHLIIDIENDNKLLMDIYNNEDEFPFMTKIFDSNDYGFNYKTKIFKINYELINKIELK